MVWGDHKRTIAGLAVVAFTIVALTACSGASTSAGGDSTTLAQTKSPVQLLRNEAASRVDEFIVDTVDETDDASISCKGEDEDPLGLSRKWSSGVSVSLKAGSAWRLDIVVSDLIATFTEQGWVAEEKGEAGVTNTELTSDTSLATIALTSAVGDDATGVPAKLEIVTTGPCVETDGAESDEVAKLEKVSAAG